MDDKTLSDDFINEEVDAIEKVIDAMLFYKDYASLQFKRHLKCLKNMSVEDKKILAPALQSHINQALMCAKANQDVFERIVQTGYNMFVNDTSLQKAYERVRNAGSTEHYMSKAKSTLKQIVRDWSREGETERKSCYDRCMKGKNLTILYLLFEFSNFD
jgi:carnosine N-methyltransferase